MPELKIDYRDIDPAQLGTYQAIAKVAKDKEIPFIIVGASARDLVMHHGYGMPIKRATRDIDFAIQVPDWDAFEEIHAGLIDEGYKATKHKHRLLDQRNIPLDIIPFGPIQPCGAAIVKARFMVRTGSRSSSQGRSGYCLPAQALREYPGCSGFPIWDPC